MRQKELEKWLKIVIIAVALCGLVVCAVAIPWIGHVLIASDPQLSDMYIPWLVLFIISAIPCYVILYLGWRVAVNIGKIIGAVVLLREFINRAVNQVVTHGHNGHRGYLRSWRRRRGSSHRLQYTAFLLGNSRFHLRLG